MNKLLSVLFPLVLVACGGSALDRHVTFANVVRVGLDATAEALEVVCDPERVEAQENPQKAASRCLKAFEGHDTSRAGWLLWRDAIIASEGDPEALEVVWEIAAPVLATYDELAEFLAEFDISLPEVPGA